MHTFVWVPTEAQKRALDSLEFELQVPDVGRGPLEEYHVFLTTEPSLLPILHLLASQNGKFSVLAFVWIDLNFFKIPITSSLVLI